MSVGSGEAAMQDSGSLVLSTGSSAGGTAGGVMLNAGDTSSAGAGSAVSISAGRSEALGGSVLVAAETGDVDEGDVILPAGSGEAGACDRIALLDGRARDESQWTAKVAWTHRVLQGNT